jgi:hypothetical protein
MQDFAPQRYKASGGLERPPAVRAPRFASQFENEINFSFFFKLSKSCLLYAKDQKQCNFNNVIESYRNNGLPLFFKLILLNKINS